MKKNSLKSKIWIYLLLFTIIILGGLWVLQVLFLNKYYEWSKTTEIKHIASKIKESYKLNDYIDILDSLAFKEDVCIEITSDSFISYTTDSISRGCLINSSNINKYKYDFMKSNEDSIIYKITNQKFENKILIYGLKLDDDSYAFISTSLEPISSTVTVLKSQLIHVTVVVVIIAFLISYTISKKISKPIEKITETSRLIARGNYEVKFDAKTDISEIKDLESALNKASLELSKTEDIRRELMANVSHDLKTPLTLIKANAEMVKDLTYKNQEKREKNLNTIISEVDRLNLLVEDILNLSSMQANAVKLDIEEFDLKEVIETIISRFSVLCDSDGYKISFKGFKYKIKADKKKMEQVIYNLINNAINYTGPDKKVFISMIKINNKVRVNIKDTGVGINKEELEHIWDKYYKVDRKYKRVTYGTGLGLSIVKNILVMHKFDYGVESKKTKGSTFYFEV